MTKKKLVLEFTFEEVYDPVFKYTSLEITKIERTRNDLARDEMVGLGEDIAQSDYWQVDRWIDIQSLLGDSDTKKVKIK